MKVSTIRGIPTPPSESIVMRSLNALEKICKFQSSCDTDGCDHIHEGDPWIQRCPKCGQEPTVKRVFNAIKWFVDQKNPLPTTTSGVIGCARTLAGLHQLELLILGYPTYWSETEDVKNIRLCRKACPEIIPAVIIQRRHQALQQETVNCAHQWLSEILKLDMESAIFPMWLDEKETKLFFNRSAAKCWKDDMKMWMSWRYWVCLKCPSICERCGFHFQRYCLQHEESDWPNGYIFPPPPACPACYMSWGPKDTAECQPSPCLTALPFEIDRATYGVTNNFYKERTQQMNTINQCIWEKITPVQQEELQRRYSNAYTQDGHDRQVQESVNAYHNIPKWIEHNQVFKKCWLPKIPDEVKDHFDGRHYPAS